MCCYKKYNCTGCVIKQFDNVHNCSINSFAISWLLWHIVSVFKVADLTYTVGHKKHTKMCFAITFVKLGGFWTNFSDCFLNKFFIKQCKHVTWTEYQLHTICWNLKVTNTTARLHTVHRTPSSCYDVKPQTSLDQMSGQRIHQTSIQLTIGSGGWYKTSLSDSNSGHRWSEAAPYLCLGWAEAKRCW